MVWFGVYGTKKLLFYMLFTPNLDNFVCLFAQLKHMLNTKFVTCLGLAQLLKLNGKWQKSCLHITSTFTYQINKRVHHQTGASQSKIKYSKTHFSGNPWHRSTELVFWMIGITYWYSSSHSPPSQSLACLDLHTRKHKHTHTEPLNN